jgi:hypothetical protein
LSSKIANECIYNCFNYYPTRKLRKQTSRITPAVPPLIIAANTPVSYTAVKRALEQDTKLLI